jgi:hypothetical protein
MTTVECTQKMFVHGEMVVVETMTLKNTCGECADSIT